MVRCVSGAHASLLYSSSTNMPYGSNITLTSDSGQVHYRVGKKIGEGSFGVIFEGTNLLNNQQVAIKFVCTPRISPQANADQHRNHGKAMHHSCAMSTVRTKYLLAAVSAQTSVDSIMYANSEQLVSPMSTTLAKRAFTTSSSSTFWDLLSRISSTTAIGGSLQRLW